ncbi:Clp protease N-terminal domain-containing protein [Agromyces aurantiacus]|uniref:Clp protease N-terminal domain-containing protein n=1 Tax=Agromyces aurantiacus TaxID=165814 RepID=A0ABV9R0X1_9MICO|nr:Clp protease N-terminal domain-containing protein [Agromyces aurantiacus]MBM7505484.1 ATP-dependent Clp protease ATP-binding subunit ClpA [Agromyces aurantiacus]
MFERFARAARAAVTSAVEEAGRRGDRRVSTDLLLIGVLHDPGIAREVGAGADDARRAASQLDRDALAAVGVEADAFGPLGRAAGAPRLPFTPGAKAVLRRTLALASADHARRIEPTHLLHALLERRAPDPAAELLAALRAEPGAPDRGR